MIDNKIDKLNTTQERYQFCSNHLHQTAFPYIQHTERIFPTPSFLFESKDDHKLSEPRKSFESFSHFRPKFEPKSIRGVTSKGNRIKISSNRKQNDVKVKKYQPAKVYPQKIEKEIESARKDHNKHLQIRQSLAQDLSEDELNVSPKRYESSDISPYARYSTNIFPKKTLISKGKLPTKNEFLIQIGNPSIKTLNEQISQLEGRISKLTMKNMQQVMTIFSIKQQKCERKSQATKSYARKLRITQGNSPQKTHLRISLKKKKEMKAQEPHFTLDKIYSKKIYSFMTFVLKLRYSNNIPISKICLSDRYNNQKTKVYVGGGNNKYLIIALLKRRFWLEVSHKITADTKFIWTQNTIKDIHNSQKSFKNTKKQQNKAQCNVSSPINGQETDLQVFNSSIINSICDPKINQQNYSTFLGTSKLPHSISQNFQVKYRKIAIPTNLQNKKIFLNASKSDQIESHLKHFKIHPKENLLSVNPEQFLTITNHIPNNSFIGSKKALFYTMEHYYRNIKQIDPFTIIPKTYHFKSAEDQGFINFLQTEKQNNQKKIWIVKPGECTNRGTGIKLMRTSQISRRLLKKQYHPNGQIKTTIVQSYITDPLLYHNRKFDIRHYMLITMINGSLKAYWYDEGYLRTSSEYFSLDNLEDMYIHLTNDAIQKTSEKYGKQQQGNKVSYQEFQRYLDSNYCKKKINLREDILIKMKDIATDVVRANYLNLDQARKMNNFEIFGLDFMIDSKFRPWLIEINANPCLETSCPLLSRIIPTMVEHSLRIGLDPLILPPTHYPPKSRYYLSDHFLQKLKYQIIFDDLQQQKDPMRIQISYDFNFDEPEDEYESQGTEIDLRKMID